MNLDLENTPNIMKSIIKSLKYKTSWASWAHSKVDEHYYDNILKYKTANTIFNELGFGDISHEFRTLRTLK